MNVYYYYLSVALTNHTCTRGRASSLDHCKSTNLSDNEEQLLAHYLTNDNFSYYFCLCVCDLQHAAARDVAREKY